MSQVASDFNFEVIGTRTTVLLEFTAPVKEEKKLENSK